MGSAGQRQLSSGRRGHLVFIAMQKRGYYSGPVDGDIGPRSRAAIREYQAEHGLEANGRIDDPLLRSLGF